jgi:hypothetical protein
MENLYTYEDWRFGHVVLKQSFLSSDTVEISGPKYFFDETEWEIVDELAILKNGIYRQHYLNQKIVDWSSFSTDAAKQIKSEQNQIFQELTEELYKNFKKDFIGRLKNSAETTMLYDIEFKQCELILFGGWQIFASQSEFQWNNNFKVINKLGMFHKIEKYCFNTIINGNSTDITDFIHSKFFNVDYEKYHSIQASACYLYYQWLKKEQEMRTGINPYPLIFTSQTGFQIFNAYFVRHLRKDQLHADISYLYHKMSGYYDSNGVRYLHQGIKHNEFIKFCQDHFSEKLEDRHLQVIELLSQLKKNQKEPKTLKSQFDELEKEITKG